MKTITPGTITSFDYVKSDGNKLPCLLFLHGLQTRKEIFSRLRQDIANTLSFPQLAVDLIGFGASRPVNDFDYDILSQTQALIKFLEDHDIQTIIVIGHSVGGMVGTLLLDLLDAKVKSLISLEGNLTLSDCGESRTVASLSYEEFKINYYQSLKLKLQNSSEKSATLRASSLNKISDEAFYKTSQSIVAWSASGKLLDIFHKSPKSKLLIRGADSSYQSLPMDDSIAHATIPASGHFMILDNPEELSRVIINNLNEYINSR